MPLSADIRYKQPNHRQCYYWLVKECLLGKSPCSYSCPGYLSVARAEKKRQAMRQEKYRD